MYLTKYLSSFPLGDGRRTLWLNGLSGALDIVTNDLFWRLRDEFNLLQGDIVEILKQRGYLFSSPDEEKEKLETMLEKSRTLRKGSRPKCFVICPTYDCNLSCVYCFEKGMNRNPKVMTEEEIKRAFEAIKTLSQEEEIKPEIQLFGGEPLLAKTKKAVESILKKSMEEGYKVSIVTNGTMVASFEDLFMKYRQTISFFQITVDGVASIHNARRNWSNRNGEGTFKTIISGINSLLTGGFKVNMRVNLDRQNIEHLPQLSEFTHQLGWANNPDFKCSLVSTADHTGKSNYPYLMAEDEIVRELAKLFKSYPNLKKLVNFSAFRIVNHIAKALGVEEAKPSYSNFYYCEACLLEYYVFGVDGYLYACPEAISQFDFAIGRFLPKLEIFEEKMALWEDRHALKMEKCRNCEIVTFCAGGCPYSALWINGDINKPFCNNAKKVLERYVLEMMPLLTRVS